MIVLVMFIFIIYLSVFIQLRKSQKHKSYNDVLTFSIVIAAKNEENNITKIINSLLNQHFPKENYEIILVDDNSEDSTFEVAKSFSIEHNNVKVLKAENKKYHGKRGALQIGIDNSLHDFILITDADCAANNGFIKSYSDMFQRDYDFLFGISPIIQNNLFVNKIACFDNLWVHILTFSFANIGLPYSAAARSFGFKKRSFNKISGFKNTTDTISGDDDLLLREAVTNKLNVGTVIHENSFVFTESKKTLSEFINQKSRHTSTSNYYTIKIKLILGTWHILNLVMLFSLFFVAIEKNLLLLFIIKILGDLFIVRFLMSKFAYNFKLLEILPLQIIYEVMLIINYFLSFFKKNKW
jgi:glycosyltransferase involved in cell wall biosynthesis